MAYQVVHEYIDPVDECRIKIARRRAIVHDENVTGPDKLIDNLNGVDLMRREWGRMHSAALRYTYVLVRWVCGPAHARHDDDAFGQDIGRGRSMRSIWDTLESSESMSA